MVDFLEGHVLVQSGSFLLYLSVVRARSILRDLAMDPAVRLVSELCQDKQIVSAE
jgi:hypothetical protein